MTQMLFCLLLKTRKYIKIVPLLGKVVKHDVKNKKYT